MLMDDCLRCHGMHFEGGIRGPGDSGEPQAARGSLRHAGVGQPAFHAVPDLSRSPPAKGRRYAKDRGRRALAGTGAGNLTAVAGVLRPPHATVRCRSRPARCPRCWKEAAPVKMSPDQRQALCYQCHAPTAAMQVATRRRSHGGWSARRHQLPGVPRAARPEDARFLRHLPSQDVELRAGRREDGHHVPSRRQQAQHPLGKVRRLPYQGSSEEESQGVTPRPPPLDLAALLFL